MQITNGGMRLTSTEMQSPAAPTYAIDVRAKLAIDAIIAIFQDSDDRRSERVTRQVLTTQARLYGAENDLAAPTCRRK